MADAQDFFPQIMLTYNIRRAVAPAAFAELLALGAARAVLLYDGGATADEAGFQKAAEPLVALIKARGLPALIAENSSLCGRLKADGVHLEEQSGADLAQLAALRQKYGGARILGYGNPRSRHNALEAGEREPDYIFFGKLGKDSSPKPHPRNLALAGWWVEIMQPPCVAQAGADLEHLAAAAQTNAEFIALEEAVFAADNPLKALESAQKRLAEWRGQSACRPAP